MKALQPGHDGLPRTRRRISVIAALGLTTSLMAVPATAAPTPGPSTPTTSTASTAASGPMEIAQGEAKKQNKRVEIPSYQTETSTTFANPDGKTLYTELYSTPIRVQKNGTWQPVDTTLVEEGGVIRPKAVKGEFTLSAGGDTTLLKTKSGKRQAAFSSAAKLPKPQLAGDTATYPSAYGQGIDLVVIATPTGFQQKLVIRERPTAKKKLSLRIPVDLPKGMRYGKDSSGKPALLNDKADKKPAPITAAPMLDATAVQQPETGHVGAATTATEQNGDDSALLLTPDASFLADPAVAYPVTIALASDTWTGTGIAGDTFVSTSYPNGNSNNINYQRIIAGKSNSGTATWRAYIDFNIKGTPLERGTVENADLRLWNFRANACTSEINSGIVARRITSDWSVSGITWSNQPSVTTGGQVGNKGAYSDDCSRGEGELYYSIETMMQAWMNGAPDHGVQLSSASESDSTNWRWYRSYEYGGYAGGPRGPVLFVQYVPAPVLTIAGWSYDGEDEIDTYQEVLAALNDPQRIRASTALTLDPPIDWADNYEQKIEPDKALITTADDILNEPLPEEPPTPTPVPGVDTTEPTVVAVNPTTEAFNVSTNTQVTATFSEPVTDAQFSLTDSITKQQVAGTSAMSSDNITLTFTLGQPLSGIYYSAQINGAKDAAGNVMAAPYSWRFTTTDPPNPTSTPTGPPAEQHTVSFPVQADTWIDNQGATGPDGPDLWAGAYGSSSPRAIERTYLKFDTSSLAGKTITDAKLELWSYDAYGCGVIGSGIKVQKVTSAWSASTLAWSNKPSETSSGEAVATDPGGCSGTPPENVAWTWPVTGIMQAWASGENNRGLVLRGVDESSSAPLYDRGFYSSEFDGLEPHPPVLKVTYTDTPGSLPSPTVTPTPTVAPTASPTPTVTPTASPSPTPTSPPNTQTISLPVQTDTWIDSEGVSEPDWGGLWAGVYSDNGARVIDRTYMKFDTSLLAGKTVTDAKLELWAGNGDGCGNSSSGIKAQRVTTAWNASTLTWANKPSTTTSGEATAKDPDGCIDQAPYDVGWTWPITGLVQAWASGQNNYGLLLRGVDESSSAPTYDRGYHASEYNDPDAHPPVLKVTYVADPGFISAPVPTPEEKKELQDSSHLSNEVNKKPTIEKPKSRRLGKKEPVDATTDSEQQLQSAAISTLTPPPAANEYTRITKSKCEENRAKASNPSGWIMNRHSWCSIGKFFLKVVIGEGDNAWIKTLFSVDSVTLAYTFSGSRSIKPQYGETTRDIIIDFYMENPTVLDPETVATGLKVGVMPGESPSQCEHVTQWNGSPNDNNASHLLSDWGGASHRFRLRCPETNAGPQRTRTWNESDGNTEVVTNKEKVTLGSFKLYGNFVNRPIRYNWTGSRNANERGTTIRCDTAEYLGQGNGGCIFNDGVSSLEHQLNRGYDRAYEHYWMACYQPNRTYPIFLQLGGFPAVHQKSIPGCLDPNKNMKYNYLHRVDTKTGDSNRGTYTRPECTWLWGNYSAYGNECDEFPFAKTRERWQDKYPGAILTRAGYSLCPMPSDDNGKAGSLLSSFYSKERMLVADPFFIRFKKKINDPPACPATIQNHN